MTRQTNQILTKNIQKDIQYRQKNTKKNTGKYEIQNHTKIKNGQKDTEKRKAYKMMQKFLKYIKYTGYRKLTEKTRIKEKKQEQTEENIQNVLKKTKLHEIQKPRNKQK